MKLVTAEISGFRRFDQASVYLDQGVVAVVGPNEAGKTSLLEALVSVENRDTYSRFDLTRGSDHEDTDVVVALLYELDKQEKMIAHELGAVGIPRWYILEKHVDGEVTDRVEDNVFRDHSARKGAIERLAWFLDSQRMERVLSARISTSPKEGERPPDQVLLRGLIESLHSELAGAGENLSASQLDQVGVAIEALVEAAEGQPKSYRRSLEITRERLETMHSEESKIHPRKELLRRLSLRRPRFLFFEDEHRHLKAEYSLSELREPPPALSNIFQLAETDLNDLIDAIDSQDHARRETILNRANEVLVRKFTEAWGQSSLSVHFQFDAEILRILINASKQFSHIAERSDGLKAFISLFAYTVLQEESDIEPILLIDEAERHLHYDAQADLVRVFENQDRAAKIIYTTHSAGCLPSDLGTGIRTVAPIILEDQDTGTSQVSNSFWTAGTGFSPLMLAMGASVMALVPARLALFAEGPSDMILLPTMFREATDLPRLPFQVAPGISRVSPEDVASLELEAPRVAYLLDGDQGGDDLARKLQTSGVPAEQVVQLHKPLALEDFLRLDVLVEAINQELERSHGGQYQIDEELLGARGRMANLFDWCKSEGIGRPSKMHIAARIIEGNRSHSILDETRSPFLRRTFDEIANILGIEQDR